MTINRITQGNKITLAPEGWMDTQSTPEFAAEVEKIGNVKEIVLDFDKLEYISSSGLRQVVACHKKAKEMGAAFSIINVGTEVMTIFRMTCVDRKMTIIEK